MNINHPTLTVLEEYTNNRTKIKLLCNKCGNTFKAVPASLYMKHGCPYCNGHPRKNTEQFIEEMRLKNPQITILGEYKNSSTPIKVKCNVCNHEWSPIPNQLFSKGDGCPKCAGTIKKTQEQFISEMKELHPTIVVIGNYVNNRTKVKCYCTECGEYFSSTPHQMLSGGNGCPKCTKSRGENKIKNWLKENNISYISQHTFDDCKDSHVLPFDFYLPNKNTVIEYDGIQHFKKSDFFGGEQSFNKLQEHDKIKNNYCKKNNITMLRIPYTNFENINEILAKQLAS